jgi:hypothetical protein
VTRHHHRASMSAPLSTKIVVFLGVALVVVGFGVAGWQRLTAHDAPDGTSVPAQTAQYLPDIGNVVAYVALILIAVVGGAYVLVRSHRRRAGL